MKPLRLLRVRLFLSYLAVVVVATGIVFGTTRLIAPTFFRVNLEEVGPPPPTAPTTSSSDSTAPTTSSATSTVGTTSTSAPAGSTSTSRPASTTTSGPGGSTSTPPPGTTSTSRPGGPTTTTGGSTSTSGPGGSTSTSRPGGSTSTTGGPPSTGGPGGQGGALAGTFAAGEQVLIPDDDINEAFLSALDTALFVAFFVSLLLAGAFAGLMARRIMRPIAAVRSATLRLAEGRYTERVPVPSEEELAGLARDVNTLAETLEQTEQRRARLISDVAHELRTPLTTIEGYMEGLIDGVLEPSEEVFASVAEEASRLQRVVADLGLLSRLDEAALVMNLEMVEASMVAGSVAERLRPQFLDKGVEVKVETEGGLMVMADRDRLSQVFTNLIGNALTHTQPGGRVMISGRAPEKGWVEVSVSDTGAGIAAADLERVFERFYRVEGGERVGSGLGLTIARSIVRAHGGEVTAESEGPGRGSRFVVRLPAGG